MTRRGSAGQRGRDGAATLVTHHHDKTRTEMIDCIFNAAKSMIVHHVAGSADNEEVANVGVEHDLGCGP